MKPVKTVLTTGQVAKICNVAPRTVSKWFDQGHLRGYRIPGSKDRRIPLDQLIQFMRANHIPLEGLETGEVKVLVLEGDAEYCRAIGQSLNGDEGYAVATATQAFEAGVIAHARKPHVLVVDVGLADIEPKSFCRFVRSCEDLKDVKLIGMDKNLSEAGGQALLQAGFDAYLSKPFQTRALIELIERARY